MSPGFFFCPTWMMNYWYFIGWPPNKFIKYCEKEFNHTPEIGESSGGKMIEISRGTKTRMVIWTRDKTDLGSLVHECIHAAHFTLQIKGFKPDFLNDEPVTYLVQSIFNHALKSARIKIK